MSGEEREGGEVSVWDRTGRRDNDQKGQRGGMLAAAVVTWQIAVRNDCGLIRPDSQVTLGISIGASVHACSCSSLFCQSNSQDAIARPDGQASFTQPP